MPTRIPLDFYFSYPWAVQPKGGDAKTPGVSSSWLPPAILPPLTTPWAAGPPGLLGWSPDMWPPQSAHRLGYYKRTFELENWEYVSLAAAGTGCENSLSVGFLFRSGGLFLANGQAVETLGAVRLESQGRRGDVRESWVEPTAVCSKDICPTSWGQLSSYLLH